MPTDLSALDPTQPPLAFARRVAGVRLAAAEALRRRRVVTPLAIVAQWRLPLMAAVFLLMLASGALIRSVQTDGIDAVGTDEVADVLDATVVLGDGAVGAAATSVDILLGGNEQ